MHLSTVALGLTALVAQGASASYQLTTLIDQKNFFQSFQFFDGADPTMGFVKYVNQETANNEKLAGVVDGAVYMGVDYTSGPDQGVASTGRKSVRVESYETFTKGLFIADIKHMPSSTCGVWPAFWSFGPNWPSSGEIDMIEGVNTQTTGIITLHTSATCNMTNDGSLESTTIAQTNCNAGNGNNGCDQHTTNNQNYGDGFNAIGGGAYAMEWTSDHIAVWFFPRSSIPQDIASEKPDPSGWGKPAARFVGGSGCNIDEHFMNHKLIFDTTFCGAWAGSKDIWDKNAECSALASTCNDYVLNNPGAFKDAYWLVNSIKVYNNNQSGDAQSSQQPTGTQQPTSTGQPAGTQQPTHTEQPSAEQQPQPTQQSAETQQSNQNQQPAQSQAAPVQSAQPDQWQSNNGQWQQRSNKEHRKHQSTISKRTHVFKA